MRGNNERIEQDLQRLAYALNSNEGFEMDNSFNLTFVHVRAQPRGSGRKIKNKPGHRHPDVFRKIKKNCADN